ncbi:hypothetical protein LCGC14_1780950, partial [marine sediment metagenome]
MPTLEEQIRALSPAALDIFKQQLPQRLKELSPLDRNTALDQLMQLPELKLGAQPAQPRPQPQAQPQPETPWWQQPLNWLRTAEQAVGTFLGAPFTPAVPGTEGLSWWERERAEYEAWEAPSVGLGFNYPGWLGGGDVTIGVKGALESVPWFATALATAGLGATAALGTRAGISGLTRAAAVGQKVIKPVVAVERTLAYPITKPLQLAGREARKLIVSATPASRFTAPASEVIESVITKDDWQRRVAQMFGRRPIFKSITERIGGRAATVTTAVEDTTAR